MARRAMLRDVVSCDVAIPAGTVQHPTRLAVAYSLSLAQYESLADLARILEVIGFGRMPLL